jgi:hypothetical protein
MNSILALTIILIALTSSISSKTPQRRRENTVKKKDEQQQPPPPPIVLPVVQTTAMKPEEVQPQIDTGECATNSLLKETYWTFKGDKIKCGAPTYSGSSLCKSSLFRPTSVSCKRSEESPTYEEFNPANYLIHDSENDNYKQLIGSWTCETPSTWIDDVVIVCPIPFSVCDPMHACHAMFNPFDTIFNLICICALVIMTVFFLCVIPCLLYIARCLFVIEARQPPGPETAQRGTTKKKRVTQKVE